MSYVSFAQYYDALTQNVEYQKRADYFCGLLERYNHEPGITLDLACGTGSLTVELAKRGFDVYGVDRSSAMLSVAQQKAAQAQLNLLFLCQDMLRLDLFGTVDTVICALDSVNHLNGENEVLKAFQRVSLFLNPDGYFVFDVNTIYKHKHILANNVFIYDTDSVYCVWQNHLNEKNCRVGITLDLFGRDERGAYHRSTERFYERAYELDQVVSLLDRAGMEAVGMFDDLTFENPQETSERVVFVARKR
ncbi:class I SAM-dependent DNA methyltransferase [Caproiciproducens sp. LBM24188]|nr:class I SAM-dependent methyltransferase [Oscillospiraceae bacterium]HHV31100.1 class I SAM-dependent methyltransferase [Clostridiales bacterium]